MIGVWRELSEWYGSALKDYMAGEGEGALQRAYELGRRAIADGLGVLEMAAIHQDSLRAVLGSAMTTSERAWVVERAAAFFVESLSPFEMAFRGFREANDALRKNLEELRKTEEALRKQNRELAFAQKSVEAERQRYRDLFDFAPDGYLVTDLEGNIQEANHAAGTLLGVPSNSLAGASFLKFVKPEDGPAFRSQFMQVLDSEERKGHDWQVELLPRSGSPFPAMLSVRVVRDDGDTPTGFRWLVRDISERIRNEQERAQYLVRDLVSRAEAESSRRFAFLADASALLVAQLDYEVALGNVARLVTTYMADWCLMYLVNEDGSLRRATAAHRDPAKSDLARQLQRCPALNPRASAGLMKVLGEGRSEIVTDVTDEWLESVASGDEHLRLLRQIGFCSLVIVPLHTHGRVLGAVVIGSAESGRRYSPEDVALVEDLGRRCALAVETGRLYQAVTLERDKAAHASRAKDEFLAILSHEIRNPLTPVLGWARKLRKHSAIRQDSVLEEGVLSLERNALNIMRLVDDCLDLARISERKISLERDPIDLNELLHSSIGAVRERAQKKGVQLEMRLPPSSLWVLGDQARLEQVATNILINAVKFTGEKGRVSIRCSSTDHEAEIEFRDTGIGIAPEFLERIFEPFRQGAKEWLSSESGLGLGLTIAREIVQMHGGRIWAESKGLGHGSTFHIRLPLAPEHPERPPQDHHSSGTGHLAKPLRILLIEDSRDIVRLMKMELETLGYTVLTATDGEEGLELARRELPDVIVSDIKMPRMDGFELLQKLRSIPELASIPAVALTGLGMKKDLEEAMTAGYQALVGKPVDALELSAVIQRLVARPEAPSVGKQKAGKG